ENNILRWGEVWLRRPSVIKDSHDPDPARRFKMIYADVSGGAFGGTHRGRVVENKAFSSDGMNWRMNPDGKPLLGSSNGNLLGWDPRIGCYVWFGGMAKGHEGEGFLGRATSKDFLTWSPMQRMLTWRPVSGLAAFFYDDLYLG